MKGKWVLQGHRGLDAIGSVSGHPPSFSVANPRVQGLNELHLSTRSVIADVLVHIDTYTWRFYTLALYPVCPSNFRLTELHPWYLMSDRPPSPVPPTSSSQKPGHALPSFQGAQ